jgi:hypothetical protein
LTLLPLEHFRFVKTYEREETVKLKTVVWSKLGEFGSIQTHHRVTHAPCEGNMVVILTKEPVDPIRPRWGRWREVGFDPKLNPILQNFFFGDAELSYLFPSIFILLVELPLDQFA